MHLLLQIYHIKSYLNIFLLNHIDLYQTSFFLSFARVQSIKMTILCLLRHNKKNDDKTAPAHRLTEQFFSQRMSFFIFLRLPFNRHKCLRLAQASAHQDT